MGYCQRAFPPFLPSSLMVSRPPQGEFWRWALPRGWGQRSRDQRPESSQLSFWSHLFQNPWSMRPQDSDHPSLHCCVPVSCMGREAGHLPGAAHSLLPLTVPTPDLTPSRRAGL